MTLMLQRVGIALGANLGDRLRSLQQARDFLFALSENEEGLHNSIQAPIYQSSPMNCPEGSPLFYNTVIEISTRLDPQELLRKTQENETQLGRKQVDQINAPRLIDLDLLYYGETVFQTPTLSLPHPRIAERSFVLKPLADLHPDMILPSYSLSIQELLNEVGDSDLSLQYLLW